MAEHKHFREDLCTRCGECLTRCQYMDLTRAEAVAEIERMIAGRATLKVHKHCVSCYACNAFCPEAAEPYKLVLEAWEKRYNEEGMPVRAAYLMPYNDPNYRSDMESDMDRSESETLARWKKEPASGTVLYPGCNLLTTPWLFDLDVLDKLPVSGDWSLCCGEPYYRGGMFEVVGEIAQGLTDYYSDKKIDKMVFVCPACMNMFRNNLPNEFGARFDFECEYIADWLLREMDEGRLDIARPLGRTVTVHDSCHGRVLGGEIMERTRELYRRLGLKVIETKSHHEEGICCGIAAGLNRFMPHDILLVSRRQLLEARDTGADEMGVYCTGCFIMLNMANHLVRAPVDLVHSLEFLAEAMGKPKPKRIGKRSAKILANVTVKAMPKIISGKTYKPRGLGVAKGASGGAPGAAPGVTTRAGRGGSEK